MLAASCSGTRLYARVHDSHQAQYTFLSFDVGIRQKICSRILCNVAWRGVQKHPRSGMIFIPSCFVHCSSDDTFVILRRMTSRPLQPPATQTPPTVTAQVISAAGTGGSSQGTASTQSSLSGSQFASLLSAIQDSE